MTPSGKGDPAAPPLIPGWQKSRVRSLLTGKAAEDSAEFWWKFDPFTHDSFARILEHQRDEYGRDVFGLGPAAMMRVKAQAWERWSKWKAGKTIPAAKVPGKAPVVRVGKYDTRLMELSRPGPLRPGTGFMRAEEFTAYFRQTAPATIPGRPRGPYNRLLQQIYGGTPTPPKRGGIAIKPPKPMAPKPPTPIKPKAEPPRAFEELVLAAVDLIPAGKGFGDDRVFIHHVWEIYLTLPGAEKITLAEFKARLAENITLRYRMVRADLVQAMDPADVAAAQTELWFGKHLGASWHFFRRKGT